LRDGVERLRGRRLRREVAAAMRKCWAEAETLIYMPLTPALL
jgi:hypothetical protein